MISTVILTKNEETLIASCIDAVSFTDEVIVIDNGSKDNTIQVAQNNKARVIKLADADNFSKLRNMGLEEARNDWVLFIDADEIVSKELSIEIQKELEKPRYNSYYLKRRDHWRGKVLRFGEVYSAYHCGYIRLLKKGSGTWKNAVHEVFQTTQKIGHVKGFIDHYPHTTLHKFIYDINFYSTLRAKELYQTGKSSNSLEIFITPFLKFFYTYIVLLGFLDGSAGFIYSFMMSFHAFLVRAKWYMMKS